MRFAAVFLLLTTVFTQQAGDLRTERPHLRRGAPETDCRRAARAARDPQRRRRQAEHPAQRGAPARRCSRARVHRGDSRNHRQPAGLRRADRARGDADGPVLLPLRRPAGRSLEMESTGSVQARRARRGQDARVFARSAADDKSPIVALVAALDALKAGGLAPTSNIRVILDGEEEASSPSLVPAIARYGQAARRPDGHPRRSGPLERPADARLWRARNRDPRSHRLRSESGVHSGNYGNWMPNPALRLAALLASMKDDDGRVKVAGYYDAVAPLTAEERAMLDAVPDDAARMLQRLVSPRPRGRFRSCRTRCSSRR